MAFYPSQGPQRLLRDSVDQVRRPRDPLTVTDNTEAWEIYNHRAYEVDRELIKDWSDGLNTLLIFAALYSAVLTAFIIESMKLLQENSTDTTRDILLVITKQLANTSTPPFEQTPFAVQSFAIRVNCYFFTSISCSLLAALCAVLALQWVANYDLGLNTSSPRKRALQRQFRFMGAERWKMSNIIASLPLLIFVALFLFFVGLADWLWHVNRIISAIVIAGIAIGGALYLITNMISSIWIDAPFRSPVPKALAVPCRNAAAWARILFLQLPRDIRIGGWSWPSVEKAWNAAYKNALWAPKTFAKCEENLVDTIETIPLDGLLWLANSIDILPGSRKSLEILIKEIMGLKPHLLMQAEKVEHAPWESMFNLLCQPYFGKRSTDDYEEQQLKDAKFLCRALSMIPTGIKTLPYCIFYQSLQSDRDRVAASFAYLASYRQTEARPLKHLLTGFQSACELMQEIPPNYFHFYLLNIKQAQLEQNLILPAQNLNAILKSCFLPSEAILNNEPFRGLLLAIEPLEILVDILIRDNENTSGEFSISRVIKIPERRDLMGKVFLSVEQQIFANIVRIDRKTIDWERRLDRSLDLLSRIACYYPNSPTTTHLLDCLSSMIKLSTVHERAKIALASRFSCLQPSNDESSTTIVDTILVFDLFLTRNPNLPKDCLIATLDSLYRILDNLDPPLSQRRADCPNRLITIKHSSIAFVASCHLPQYWLFPTLTNLLILELGTNRAEEIACIWNLYRPNQVLDGALIHFLRRKMEECNPRFSGTIVGFLTSLSFYIKRINLQQFCLPEALNKTLQYYLQEIDRQPFPKFPLFSRFSYLDGFSFFFSMASGANWLAYVMRESDPNDVVEIFRFLAEQLVFSRSEDDIIFWLQCSRVCLQILEHDNSLGFKSPRWHWDSNERPPRIHMILPSPGIPSLYWAIQYYLRPHTLIDWRRVFVTEDRQQAAIRDENPTLTVFPTLRPLRRQVLDEMRIIRMGADFGGLGVEANSRHEKYLRDPDGLCSWASR
ncbi:hypothetical protein CPB86DRAFT_878328 [Serendipita vermifera]|nr:hypothetical protein CPB86DRAFT_878328 [Serendipita vermifera]